MAITDHQGTFQRVTKLLRALHMIDLLFFPLVSSLKSRGGEATFLCLHRHHHYTINSPQVALLRWRRILLSL